MCVHNAWHDLVPDSSSICEPSTDVRAPRAVCAALPAIAELRLVVLQVARPSVSAQQFFMLYGVPTPEISPNFNNCLISGGAL
jgi:hypothetical protein